jgi:hypothetical protein
MARNLKRHARHGTQQSESNGCNELHHEFLEQQTKRVLALK